MGWREFWFAAWFKSKKMKGLTQYIERRYPFRAWKSRFLCGLMCVATGLAVLPLGSLVSHTVLSGIPGVSLAFFTQLPKPVGEIGGGMANALVGTLILVGLGSFVGIVWGMSIGIFLSEYGRGKLSGLIRFVTDLLASVPSIVIGLFIYALIVLPMRRFSALAGGLALGIMMIPMIARNTEELLRMVPVTYREAGLALGLPRWRVITSIALRAALPGIFTGILLALARISGETAPLLFTALNNQFWSSRLDQPIASLPVQIYTYAISPFKQWHEHAWAGALVLLCFVVVINLATRFAMSRIHGGSRT